MEKKVHITEVVLRDANQSLIATRMPRSDFEDILETMDQAGYYSMEVWGGATFDSCLRYLDEDPWDRLRFIRSKVKNTKLQMLLRGQNILGYRHYSDDTVRAFVRKSVENGIDIIRIFDALNDPQNMATAIDECLKAGGHAQGTICYTISPIHTFESYVELGKKLESMGCNSICIKDMAGIMSPQVCYDLVKALKKEVRLPIYVHSHSTTGLGPMTLLKAIEAGADGVDTAISIFSGGTSHPSTESLVYTLNEMNIDSGVDLKVCQKINDHFKPVQARFLKEGGLNPSVLTTKIDALNYQIPGGMLSNLISQLTAVDKLDRLDEVLEETPRVREDMGYPPLVTPMSQMVGTQAVTNVLTGERYKLVSKEIKAYCRGEYGASPAPISKELMEKALGDEKPFEGRYDDTIEPEIPGAKAYLGDLAESEEDVLSYVAFPQQAEAFLKERREKKALKVTYSIQEVE
ncbi:MAG: pyruvate carboxylase subunit B [Solobacterium sp.]|nr:pyruvate carboxylase subunit B [Erysipelotrichaceae bacterium]MBQ9153407.1 pyruvate carboxylase subunit B [Solobacterium sp.]